MAAVSADGSTVWVLILRLNSSCSRSIAFVVRWIAIGSAATGEGEEPVAGFLQAVGNRAVFEPPLADEGLAAGFDLLGRVRVDHVVVVGAESPRAGARGHGRADCDACEPCSAAPARRPRRRQSPSRGPARRRR